MDLFLKGKRALVSGSSSGLGAECARTLAREGVSVVVTGQDKERATAVAKEITDAGGTAKVTIGDLRDDEAAYRIAEDALDAFGGIDILVNNAGRLVRPENPDWTTVPMSDWVKSFQGIILGAVALSQKLAPGMVERGWGRIINFSSVAGYQALGQLLEYGPAKAAVHNFTINLSRMLAPKGVTVNTIAPGMFVTPGIARHMDAMAGQPGWADTREENEKLYCTKHYPQPIPRGGKPSEIAAAVAFISSPRSDYTTGSLLRIDGGISKAL